MIYVHKISAFSSQKHPISVVNDRRNHWPIRQATGHAMASNEPEKSESKCQTNFCKITLLFAFSFDMDFILLPPFCSRYARTFARLSNKTFTLQIYNGTSSHKELFALLFHFSSILYARPVSGRAHACFPCRFVLLTK